MAKSLNISQLREELSEVIQGVKAGTMNVASANAIVNASGKILSTVKAEMEYCKLLGKTPEIPMLTAGEEEEKKK
jgi:hypothetical protein